MTSMKMQEFSTKVYYQRNYGKYTPYTALLHKQEGYVLGFTNINSVKREFYQPVCYKFVLHRTNEYRTWQTFVQEAVKHINY